MFYGGLWEKKNNNNEIYVKRESLNNRTTELCALYRNQTSNGPVDTPQAENNNNSDHRLFKPQKATAARPRWRTDMHARTRTHAHAHTRQSTEMIWEQVWGDGEFLAVECFPQTGLQGRRVSALCQQARMFERALEGSVCFCLCCQPRGTFRRTCKQSVHPSGWWSCDRSVQYMGILIVLAPS